MFSSHHLCFAAAVLAGLLGVGVALRKRSSVARWSFCLGMLVFSFNSVMGGMALRAGGDGDRFAFWHRTAFAGQAFLPGFWLCFSLSFARGNFRAVLRSWRPTLVAAFLVPAALAFGFPDQLILLTPASGDHDSVLRFGPAAWALAMIGLVAAVLVLANLERTFRASVGTTRWRVKYMVLGAGAISVGQIWF